MMKKLIIDLSKSLNNPDRMRIIPLTEEELELRYTLRDEAILNDKDDEELKKKRNELVTELATKLNVDRDELAGLFAIEKL